MKQMLAQFPDVNFFLHASTFIDSKGDRLGIWQCPLPSFPNVIKPQFMIERLLVQNFISIPAPMVKREVALQVGGLDETAWYTADWDFWLKIAAQNEALYYPKPLTGFRIHRHSQTIVRSAQHEEFQEQLRRVAEKHFALWVASERKKKGLSKLINFSIIVNSALADTLHGKKPDLPGLSRSFLTLGPLGWHRFFRDSRIWERTTARLKALLKTPKSFPKKSSGDSR